MKYPVLLMLILSAATLSQAQKQYAFTPGEIQFVTRNAGLKINGSVGGLTGYVIMDSSGETIRKIEGSVEVNTIHTGIRSRDEHLKRSDYFNVKTYPKIFLTSMQVQKTGQAKYRGTFSLTIKNITKTITIPFSYIKSPAGYLLSGEFTINRLDYELGESSIILSDQVKIKIAIPVQIPG